MQLNRSLLCLSALAWCTVMTSAATACCDLGPPPRPAGPPEAPIGPFVPAGTYYNGAGATYGPGAEIVGRRYPRPVRIHGWPLCYWGAGNEVWDGYHLVGPRVGYCD